MDWLTRFADENLSKNISFESIDGDEAATVNISGQDDEGRQVNVTEDFDTLGDALKMFNETTSVNDIEEAESEEEESDKEANSESDEDKSGEPKDDEERLKKHFGEDVATKILDLIGDEAFALLPPRGSGQTDECCEISEVPMLENAIMPDAIIATDDTEDLEEIDVTDSIKQLLGLAAFLRGRGKKVEASKVEKLVQEI